MFVLSSSWILLLLLTWWNRTLRVDPFPFEMWAISWGLLSITFVLGVHLAQKQAISFSRTFLFLTTSVLALSSLTNHTIFTNDLSRYLWDAEVLLQGENPLIHTPNELAHLADKDISLPQDHRDTASLYPPFALFFFLLGRILSKTEWIFGLLNAGLILLAVDRVYVHLKRSSLPVAGVLWLAWHPLLHFEGMANGHVDILGVVFLTFFLISIERRREKTALLYLFCSSWVKIWPWILSACFLHRKQTMKSWVLMTLFLATSLVVYFFAWGSPRGLVSYAQNWEFFGLFYSLARVFMDSWEARLLCLGLLAVGTLAILITPWRDLNSKKKAFFILGLFLLCTPTLHPWYVLWALPFFVWIRVWEWLYFSLAIVLSYSILPNYLEYGIWHEPTWAKAVVYSPLILATFWRALRWKVSKAR